MILIENIDRNTRQATLTLDFQALRQIYVAFYASMSNNSTYPAMSVENFNQLKIVYDLIEYGMLDEADAQCILNNYVRFKEKKDE